MIDSEPSRSASSRALRAVSSFKAFGDDRQVGARDGVVEPHDESPALTRSPSRTRSFADDAAGRMLNLLDVGIDDD